MAPTHSRPLSTSAAASTMADLSNTNGGKKPTRSKGYTKIEDLLVSKAWVATSEDPIAGANQKGHVFKHTMILNYNVCLDEQKQVDRNLYSRASTATREGTTANKVYPERNAQSIYTRFKDIISHRVSKFIGIEMTTDMASGENKEDYYNRCNLIFMKRYPNLGNFDDFRECKEYLEKKPKYSKYREAMGGDKPERPIGTKKAKQQISDKAIIKEAIEESRKTSKKSDVAATVAGLSSSIDGLGKALLQHLESERNFQMMQMFSPAKRKELANAQYELMLADVNAKRRKVEAENTTLEAVSNKNGKAASASASSISSTSSTSSIGE